MDSPETLYLCDRKKCENCSYPECKHTTDIHHAVFPSVDKKIKHIQKLIDIYQSHFGDCCTCIYHSNNWRVPGFIKDHGACKKGCEHFPRIRLYTDMPCTDYSLDFSMLDFLEGQLNELKKEK